MIIFQLMLMVILFLNNFVRKNTIAIIINILLLILFYPIFKLIVVNNASDNILYNFLRYLCLCIFIISIVKAIYLIIKKKNYSLIIYLVFIYLCIEIISIIRKFSASSVSPEMNSQMILEEKQFFILLKDIVLVDFFIRVFAKDKNKSKDNEKPNIKIKVNSDNKFKEDML